MYKSLILCSAPRSGSTMLCDLLAGTGVAGRPESYFRRQSIPSYYREFGLQEKDAPRIDRAYLDAVIQEGTDDTGVFGLRLMWETLGELSVRLHEIFPGLSSDAARLEQAFGPMLFVHLTRADKIAQAISLIKAEQTGLWHRYSDGGERERTAPSRPAIFDRELIAEQADALAASDAGWRGWFARQNIAPVRVTYEDLGADPKAELAKILSGLGQNTKIADRAQVVSARMADAESAEWAARYLRETSS